MKTICQYCHIKIRDNFIDDGRISHGLCENCYHLENILLDLEELIKDRDFIKFIKKDPDNILFRRTFQIMNNFLAAIHSISHKKTSGW